jgi:hypothetical protein
MQLGAGGYWIFKVRTVDMRNNVTLWRLGGINGRLGKIMSFWTLTSLNTHNKAKTILQAPT